MTLYPLLLRAALHARVWGGWRLASVLGKTLPTAEPYGEAWEVHDTATVANGAFAGRALGDLLAEYGRDLLGAAGDPREGFPLLAKFIDSSDWLSIQVHPDDRQARELEGDPRGKSEAWYILDAQPGAQLVIGLQPGTSRATMAQAIRDNTLEALLVYADVVAGDVLYVPAGTVHAIGPGLMIYEIQQSSDITYRLYDWGRMGLDGQPRALHIEKGCAVANLDALPAIRHSADDQSPTVEIAACPYFTTVLHHLNPANGGALELDTAGRRFHILTCVGGRAAVSAGEAELALQSGQSALIPAGIGRYRLTGTADILRSWQGD